jgi:uncharacterized protein involved in exopolysaccharide biosynthesis
MSPAEYWGALRQRWPLLLAVPLLVLIVSAAAALREPARYGTGTRLLVTRAPEAGGAAGLSDRGEDTTAQDVPAIVQGSAFRADLAAELARRGVPADAAQAGALAASFSEHTVTFAAEAGDGATATALAETATTLLQTNGLRYWGDSAGAQPGLNISVLDPPASPVRLNGPRAQALQLALRTALGLGAAAGLAIALALARPHKEE